MSPGFFVLAHRSTSTPSRRKGSKNSRSVTVAAAAVHTSRRNVTRGALSHARRCARSVSARVGRRAAMRSAGAVSCNPNALPPRGTAPGPGRSRSRPSPKSSAPPPSSPRLPNCCWATRHGPQRRGDRPLARHALHPGSDRRPHHRPPAAHPPGPRHQARTLRGLPTRPSPQLRRTATHRSAARRLRRLAAPPYDRFGRPSARTAAAPVQPLARMHARAATGPLRPTARKYAEQRFAQAETFPYWTAAIRRHPHPGRHRHPARHRRHSPKTRRPQFPHLGHDPPPHAHPATAADPFQQRRGHHPAPSTRPATPLPVRRPAAPADPGHRLPHTAIRPADLPRAPPDHPPDRPRRRRADLDVLRPPADASPRTLRRPSPPAHHQPGDRQRRLAVPRLQPRVSPPPTAPSSPGYATSDPHPHRNGSPPCASSSSRQQRNTHHTNTRGSPVAPLRKNLQ